MPSKDHNPFSPGNVIVLCLQATALALCGMILLNMAVEDAAKIPTHACIDGGPPSLAPAGQ